MAKDKAYAAFDQMEDWVSELMAAKKNNATFDDASNEWKKAPQVVQELSEVVQTDVAKGGLYASGKQLVGAVLDGAISDYEKANGAKPSGAIIHNALRVALNSVSSHSLSKSGVPVTFDDVGSIQSDAPINSNRVTVVLYNTLVESVPFGGYIDMSENMAGKIIIANHVAGSTTGGYTENQSLDGILGGKPFMSHERTVEMTSTDKTTFSAKFKYADNDSAGSPIIPSATQILVNGLPSGGAAMQATVTEKTSGLSGSIEINDVTYTFTGTTTNETGEVTIKFNSAVPEGVKVYAVGLLNYENKLMKEKRPILMANARSHELRAGFYSAIYQATQEAKTQWNKEIRLDLGSESMLAMNNQYAAEKHMTALRAMYRIGKNYISSVNLNASVRQDQRSRESMWRDVLFSLTTADQNMVDRTNSFGIGVIYVGGKGKAELTALPNDVFVPSGISSRAGIYRIGTLFGQYEVYYAPNLVQETSSSIEMLCIGRSEQTGLNPYIFGDVAAPTFLKMNVDKDLREGAGYFYAGAASVNPYIKAACGASIIAITGI